MNFTISTTKDTKTSPRIFRVFRGSQSTRETLGELPAIWEGYSCERIVLFRGPNDCRLAQRFEQGNPMQTITTTGRILATAILILSISPFLPTMGLMHLIAKLHGGEEQTLQDGTQG